MLDAAYKDTLYVIRDEMNVTLNDARSALEVAIEMQQDEHFKLVKSLMHTAAGALNIIELKASAKLAAEIEETVSQLIEGQARDRDESLEAITAGVVMLPKFFSKTLDGDGVENAVALLPVLKDLRDARDGGDLSEQTLRVMALDPESVAEKDLAGQTINVSRVQTSHDLQTIVGKLRPVFQASLLGWIKGGDTQGHLARLASITEKFEQAAKQERAFKLWWIVGGIVEALQENGLKADAELRRLLGQVDRAGKFILDEGESAYQQKNENDLLNQLVRVVQRVSTSGEKISHIRRGFGLHENLDDAGLMSVAQSAMAAPDSQVMNSLSGAIKEDLEKVKDALDIFNRTGSKENLELEERFSSLKKIADTLGMLGLIDLQERLITQESNLEELISSNQKITDDHLIPIAASLLQVETRLEEELSKMAGRAGDVEKPKYLKDALAANFREIKVNLARVKETIAEFMQNPMDVKSISRAPAFLKEAQAASRMAEKDRLAEIFFRLQEYIVRQLIGSGRLPYPEHLELLAGAIESADFYLETLSKGRRDPWYMLDNAETCLDKLVVSAPEPLSETTKGGTQLMPTISSDVDIDDDATAVLGTDSDEESVVMTEAKGATVVTKTLDLGKVKDDAHPDAYPVMDRSLETDPEVIELFIEECKEVNELMTEEFNAWLEDYSNTDSLTIVRRSFHTLKGSGRMVGAMRMGEFAWQAENLANRVLDNTIQIDDVGSDLLKRSVDVVPSLIEQLESGTNTEIDVHALMLSLENYIQHKLRPEDDDTVTKLPGDIDSPNARFGDTRHFDSVDDLVNSGLVQSDRKSKLEDTAEHETLDPGATAEFKIVDSTMETRVIDPDQLGAQFTQILDVGESKHTGDIGILDEETEHQLSESPNTQIIDMRGVVHEDSEVSENPHTKIIDMRERKDNLDAYAEKLDSDNVDDSVNKEASNIYKLNPTLNQILQDETQSHLNVIRDFVNNSLGSPASTALHRAVHTLHGSVHMAEISPMVELAGAFEGLVQKLYDQGLPIDQETATLISQAADELETMVKTVNQDVPMEMPTPQLIIDLQAMRASVITQIFDPEFMNEVLGTEFDDLDIDAEIPNIIDDTNYADVQVFRNTEVEEAASVGQLDEIEREINELSVETQALALDVDIDENKHTDLIQNTDSVRPESKHTALDVDEDILEIFLEEAKDIIVATDASVANWNETGIADNDLLDMQRHLHTIKGGARMAGLLSFGDFTHEMESYVLGIQHKTIEQDDVSRRLLQSAVDELHTILDDVEARREPRPNPDILEQMRILLGDFDAEDRSEQTLSDLVSLDEDHDLPLPLESELEGLPENLDVAEDGLATEDTEELAEEKTDTESVLAELSDELESMSAELSDPASETLSANAGVEDQVTSVVDIFDYKVAEFASQQTKSRQQDAARISTNNLESLLNQAGEVSIYRSRIEQEISNATLNLSELERTVMRVREQLRNMEIETEAQILHQYKDEITNDDFDPLEMDRYSNIQQLSRALAESVNDLQSLDTLLGNQLRETEALLLQQSRVVTDLQDGLMRVRMIPFARYAPRYARIVRQVSNEVDKEVELEVIGAESEIDRQVIERMQGPLEHMIRNAIIHGVESPAVRRKAGKESEGQIKLTLSREGVNLLMTLEDDGSGLDLQRIRQKALDLNLIDKSQELTDGDLAQLILVSGFSTVSEVTQNAGRGVGMDVVANEIKQLGGSLHITTETGKGTKFNMRLPFTRAINHALMVRAGDENYAVPLHKIDGIATISLAALQRLLESDNPVYRYGEYDYDVKALTELVGFPKAIFENEESTVNMVLVSGGGHRAALAVNELYGNREMVIKPVGPQIAGIRGVSGATILGDGRIVVILDVDALLGAQIQEVAEINLPNAQAALPLIMVVDDSITVRRVTERLLERNQMQVVTARDGMNALTLLQEHKPDIILMDIEMPRMDGYELAEHVRTDKDTKDIPIIMITSRTGDKHRARAIEIGVNDYLGKPYREDQLLEALEPYLNPEEAA